MDDPEWQSVLDFASSHLQSDFYLAAERPMSEHPEHMDPAALQLPTPPESHVNFSQGQSDAEDTVCSVSTAFFHGANKHPSRSDLILVSSDSVLFYVHSHILLKVSENNFNAILSGHLPKGFHLPTFVLPESSAVLNIVLHTIYDAPCAQYSPSFDVLNAAIIALDTYGVAIRPCIRPSTPLFTVLLSQAPLVPLKVYALAAHYDLHDLAVQASLHLLSFPLPSITDELAVAIGPVYLKRLFLLHFRLMEVLKRLLLSPPHPHPPTEQCGFNEQKQLTRAWALASAYLAWDARPDLPISHMDSALGTLQMQMPCELCRQMLADRIKHLSVQWSLVKRTI